jgi:hypothetical protein
MAIFGWLMLVCNKGELPENLHARAHPWAVKTRQEMVGRGLATYVDELVVANIVASYALVKPKEERSNERA